MRDNHTEQTPLLADADSVWYFAYGSNMRSSVMAGRSITPKRTAVARIPTHVLTFDIFGFPYSEPSFASIAERSLIGLDTVLHREDRLQTALPPIHGVAYLISREEYIALVISEGGGVAYREIEVEAEFLMSGISDKATPSTPDTVQKVTVSTLEAKYPFRPNAGPSARYLGLLEMGAEEHHLPADYKKYLASLQAYYASDSLFARCRAFVFLSTWRPILRQLVKYMKANVNSEGHCEQWIEDLIVYGYGAMWFCHDWMYAPLFGRGNGR